MPDNLHPWFSIFRCNFSNMLVNIMISTLKFDMSNMGALPWVFGTGKKALISGGTKAIFGANRKTKTTLRNREHKKTHF